MSHLPRRLLVPGARNAESAERNSVPASLAVALFAVLALAVTAEPVAAVKRRAFVTSVSGTGDLGSWPDAGSATGLAAGNAICRARATAAGLPNATTYRAWLSSDTTDAYCHLRGQSGVKGACTGGTPLAAGPWYLANGITNFTGSLDELTSNDPILYRPVLRDEFDDALPAEADLRTYWTGTSPDGKRWDDAGPPWTCTGWTNGVSGSAPIGDGLATVWVWTQGGFAPGCSESRRLLCFEPGESEFTTLAWSPGSLVFQTSIGGPPNLGSWPQANGATGLAAGDAICRNLAAAAHLPAPDSFVAWLSTSAVDARDRVTSNGPFRRLDHFVVANNEADLLDGSLDTTIHLDQHGVAVNATPEIATGTAADGTASGADCKGWTSVSIDDDQTTGRPNFASLPDWTNRTAAGSCTGNVRLYCFSNQIVLFWDGFELTGDTSRWSAAVP